MQKLKKYTLGLHGSISSVQKLCLEKNIVYLENAEASIHITSALLNSIHLFLIPLTSKGKFGFINRLGELIHDFSYDEYRGDFIKDTSVVAVRKGNKWSVMDSKGNELLPFEYTTIWPSKDSTLVSIQNYEGWKVIDAVTKKTIVPLRKYDYIEGFRFGFARFKKDGLWGVVNKDGREILPPLYEGLLDFYKNWDKPETKVRKPGESKWQKFNLIQLENQ